MKIFKKLLAPLFCSFFLLGSWSVALAQSFQVPSEIKVIVEEVFDDDPIMIAIAKCESGFRQFTDSGNIFKGAGRYTGIFQIDEIIHASSATARGFDIYTVAGNIGYAKYLYQNEGSVPWKNCAKTYTPSSVVSAESQVQSDALTETREVSVAQGSESAGAFAGEECPSERQLTQNLRTGARNGRYHAYTGTTVTEAHILQAHMNRLGFESGSEDGILGPISDGAIKRMQAFLGTKADGFVGPLTRGLLNNSC